MNNPAVDQLVAILAHPDATFPVVVETADSDFLFVSPTFVIIRVDSEVDINRVSLALGVPLKIRGITAIAVAADSWNKNIPWIKVNG